MTTVLDSFVIEFGLDHKPLERNKRELDALLRNTKEEAKSSADAIEGQVKKVNDLLSSFRREAMTGLAIFFGGREIGRLVDDITKLDASTGRFSRTLGLTAAETSAWQGAIRQVGGSAESANAALRAMNDELVRYNQTGQSSALGVFARLGVNPYDKNHNLKTADQIFFDLAAGIERSGIDPRQATGLLQMAGINDDMINLILKGTKAMREYLDASRQAGTTSEMSAAQAAEYQKQMALLDQTTTNAGRNLLSVFLPALNAVASALAKLFASWNTTAGSAEDKAQSAGQRADLVNRFGSPRALLEWLAEHSPIPGDREYTLGLAEKWYGPKGADEAGANSAANAAKSAASNKPVAFGSDNAISDYIRARATSLGLDPNVAVAVWGSEGQKGYVGDEGSSFGPYQLHYGGVSSRFPHQGLGDAFTKATGLDARDPSTSRAQIDFALAYAKQHGWGSWMGWKGSPTAGGAGTGVNVNVGGVVVNDNSGNADSIAGNIGSALQRSVKAGLANAGAQ